MISFIWAIADLYHGMDVSVSSSRLRWMSGSWFCVSGSWLVTVGDITANLRQTIPQRSSLRSLQSGRFRSFGSCKKQKIFLADSLLEVYHVPSIEGFPFQKS